MVVRPPCRVFEAPFNVARASGDGVVLIYAPDGRAIALTSEAAERSAEILHRAALAAPQRVRAKVVAVDFVHHRRIARRHFPRARCARRLRAQVGSAFVPTAWAMCAGLALALAFLLAGESWTIGALPWLVAGTALVAALAAYALAPLLMTRDERRPPLRRGLKLTIA